MNFEDLNWGRLTILFAIGGWLAFALVCALIATIRRRPRLHPYSASMRERRVQWLSTRVHRVVEGVSRDEAKAALRRAYQSIK